MIKQILHIGILAEDKCWELFILLALAEIKDSPSWDTLGWSYPIQGITTSEYLGEYGGELGIIKQEQ